LEHWLGGAEAFALEHGQLEAQLEARGREVQRQLLQDHLALRQQQEPQERVLTGSDGVVRTHHRQGSRILTTVFGDVEVARQGVGARGHASLFALDGELNLPAHQYSHGVQRRAAELAARTSFDATVEQLGKTTGAQVYKRQVEQLVREAALDFDAFYLGRAAQGGQEPGALVIISCDGKGIRMLTRDLREATRKRALAKVPKLDTRRCKGEKGSTKRMAEVAAVYSIEPFIRSPEDVVRSLRPAQSVGPARPKPINKRVWASVEKGMADVVEEAFAEAARRDGARTKQWVVLVDGNAAQLERVKEAAKKAGVEVEVIVDVIHVLEYLWKAAYAFHAEGSKEAEAWVSERFLKVLQGRSSQVAGGIRRSATLQGLRGKNRAAVDKSVDYLLNVGSHLCYDRYLEHGLPISTGVIEGACRHLVKDRMDLTGARWGLKGAEAVLKLRSIQSSGDFDEYWAFHLKQDLKRNHLSRYAGEKLPEASPRLRLVR
jgi:hypothetical protein